MLLASFVWYGASLLLPQLFTPLGQTFCAENERYAAEVIVTERVASSSIGTSYVCVSAQGETRSIRGEMTRATTQVFLGLMFGGMALVAVGAGRHLYNRGGNAADTADGKRRRGDGIAPDALTFSLTQLEQARAGEMITEEEYKKFRQELLDKLV
jgi:hypothetical protein